MCVCKRAEMQAGKGEGRGDATARQLGGGDRNQQLHAPWSNIRPHLKVHVDEDEARERRDEQDGDD